MILLLQQVPVQVAGLPTVAQWALAALALIGMGVGLYGRHWKGAAIAYKEQLTAVRDRNVTLQGSLDEKNAELNRLRSATDLTSLQHQVAEANAAIAVSNAGIVQALTSFQTQLNEHAEKELGVLIKVETALEAAVSALSAMERRISSATEARA